MLLRLAGGPQRPWSHGAPAMHGQQPPRWRPQHQLLARRHAPWAATEEPGAARHLCTRAPAAAGGSGGESSGLEGAFQQLLGRLQQCEAAYYEGAPLVTWAALCALRALRAPRRCLGHSLRWRPKRLTARAVLRRLRRRDEAYDLLRRELERLSEQLQQLLRAAGDEPGAARVAALARKRVVRGRRAPAAAAAASAARGCSSSLRSGG
jgi:hypothetical protein